MSPRSRWLTLLGSAAVVVIGLIYLNRGYLLRATIAYRAYKSHIFTRPTASSGDSGFQRVRNEAEFYWDFAEVPIARQKRLEEFNSVLRPLVIEMSRAQASGQSTQYSMHIYREIRWLLNFTPDLEGTWADVDALRRSLSEAGQQRLADEQQPD